MHTFDLIIRNGTVIDPASNFMGLKDLYIKDGKFVSPAPGEAAQAEKIIDASGCCVTPGLIDAHVHLYESGSQLGGKADLVCPSNCVTTAIDAGSAGLYNMQAFYQNDIVRSTTRIKATVSPTKTGVQMAPYEEIPDPIFGTYDMLRPLFDAYPQTLVGIKQRVHREVTEAFGLRSLEQSVKTARQLRQAGFQCRLMVHFGPLLDGITLEDVLSVLDAGDVFTHIYRPDNGTTIFDPVGRVADCVKRARKRGVLFESGCARSHLSFESISRAFADGFQPQIISTDMIGKTFYWAPSGWLMLKMSIYLNAGMSLEQIVRATTYAPACAYGMLEECGTLEPGRPADVAVFRVEDRDFALDDLYGGHFTGSRLCVPMATIREGVPVFQQVYL